MGQNANIACVTAYVKLPVGEVDLIEIDGHDFGGIFNRKHEGEKLIFVGINSIGLLGCIAFCAADIGLEKSF
jgi:hypothetical protein